jgi:hypothetical protein
MNLIPTVFNQSYPRARRFANAAPAGECMWPGAASTAMAIATLIAIAVAGSAAQVKSTPCAVKSFIDWPVALINATRRAVGAVAHFGQSRGACVIVFSVAFIFELMEFSWFQPGAGRMPGHTFHPQRSICIAQQSVTVRSRTDCRQPTLTYRRQQ